MAPSIPTSAETVLQQAQEVLVKKRSLVSATPSAPPFGADACVENQASDVTQGAGSLHNTLAPAVAASERPRAHHRHKGAALLQVRLVLTGGGIAWAFIGEGKGATILGLGIVVAMALFAGLAGPLAMMMSGGAETRRLDVARDPLGGLPLRPTPMAFLAVRPAEVAWFGKLAIQGFGALSLALTPICCTGPHQEDVSQQQDVSQQDAEPVDVTHPPTSLSIPAGVAAKFPTFSLHTHPENLERLREKPFEDVEVDAEVYVDGVRYPIELELHGGSARSFDKKSFKMKFNRGTKYSGSVFTEGQRPALESGYGKLIFKAMYKDRSLIREALAWRLLREMGYPAPRVGWAALELNGQPHGIFVVVEPLDEDFLKRRGYARRGNLYKASARSADLCPGHPVSEAFEQKAGEDSGMADLEALVTTLQNTPVTEEGYLQDIDPIFSLDAYLDRMVWISYTQNTDAWLANYYLYNEPGYSRERWHILAWDSDIALGNHWSLDEPVYQFDWSHMLQGISCFSRNITAIDSFRVRYIERFEGLLQSLFSSEAQISALNALSLHLKEAVDFDLALWSRGTTAREETLKIQHYLENRPDYLREKLLEFRDQPDLEDDYFP